MEPDNTLEPQKQAIPLEIKALQAIDEESKEVFFNDKPIKFYDWVAGAEFVATPYDKTVIDMLLDGRTYGECRDAIKQFYRKELTISQIKDRLENNEYAVAYLNDRLKKKAIADGLTRESYLVMAEEIIRGVRVMDQSKLFIFKHLSKVMGWEGSSPIGVFNQNINIVQKNGKE